MVPSDFAQVVRDARVAGRALQEANAQFKETVSRVEKCLVSMGLHAYAEVPLSCGHLCFMVFEQAAVKPGAPQWVGRLMVRGTRGMRALHAAQGNQVKEAVEVLPDLMRKLAEAARSAAADLHARSEGVGLVLRLPSTLATEPPPTG